MKTLFLTCLLVLTMVTAWATDEDCRTRIRYNGYVDGAYSVTIFNKSSCPTVYEIQYPGGAANMFVEGHRDKTILITAPLSCGVVKVKGNEKCGNFEGTCAYDWLETDNVCSTLPVIISGFHVKRTTDGMVQGQFNVSETTNLKSFSVNMSVDGKEYVVKLVAPASVLKGHEAYYFTFKIK